MATGTRLQTEHYIPRRCEVDFSFAPNNTSAVDQTTIYGLRIVESVTRTDVGVFDVLFKENLGTLITFLPYIQEHTAAESNLSCNWDSSTKTLTLTYFSSGSAADLGPNTDDRLGGRCVFNKSSSLTY